MFHYSCLPASDTDCHPNLFGKSLHTILILIIILTSKIAYGHDISNKTSLISIEQGLSQNSVNCLLKDKRGFMWFATQDGLNKYDGYEFKVFEHDPQDPTSISGNYVYSILEDSKGVIWIGTDKGLSRYNSLSDNFTNYLHDPEKSNSLGGRKIQSLYEDKSGSLWVGIYGAGLNRLDKKTGTFQRFTHDASNPTSLNNNKVKKILPGGNDYFWVFTTGGGINRFDQKTNTFSHIINPDNKISSPDFPLSNYITTAHKDKNGFIWIGTREGFLDKFNPVTGKFEHYFTTGTPDRENRNSIIAIHKDKHNRIWVSFQLAGLKLFDENTKKFSTENSIISEITSKAGPGFTNTIYEDDSDIIWIGTEDSGVIKYDENRLKFKHYTIHNETTHNGKNSSFVIGMFTDSQDFLWVAVRGEGVYKLDKNRNIVKRYCNSKGCDSSLPDLNNWVIYEDRKGDIWLGAQSYGLSKLDKKLDKFIPVIPEGEIRLGEYGVTCIIEDSQDNFYLGTYGNGLFIYDRTKNTLNKKSFPKPEANLSGQNIISVIYEDKQQNIWVGTDGGGTISFTPGSDKIRMFNCMPGDANSLRHNSINSFCETSDNRLWIATYGGISEFDKTTGTFKHYDKKSGLPNNIVYSITTDNNDNLWMSTNKGLSKAILHKDRAPEFVNFDIRDGLQSNEFNMGASAKSKDGQLFFGGICGYNGFYPEEVKLNQTKPPVAITRIKVSGKTIDISRAIEFGEEIELPYTSNTITVDFAALNYTNTEKNKYAHFMEGFDEDWVYSGNRNNTTYTNLNPGKYTLRIKASNNDGIWNETGTSISFYIKPPFWKTNSFYAICIVSGLLIFVGVSQLRTQSLRKMKKMLEQTVEERTREIMAQKEELSIQRDDIRKKNNQLERARHIITQQYDELKEANSALEEEIRDRTVALNHANKDLQLTSKELDEVIYKASHDIKGPLARMIGLCNLALLDVSEPKGIEYVKMLRKEAVNTTEILTKLLAIRHLKKGIVTSKEVKVADVVRQSINSLKNLDNFTFVQFSIDIPENLKISTDQRLLRLIMTSLLENAVVFANNTDPLIKISSEINEQMLRIAVRDNGAGIPPEIAPRIFDRYFRGSERSQGAGLGLYTASAAAEKLHGSITLKHSEKNRTEFVVELPMDVLNSMAEQAMSQ